MADTKISDLAAVTSLSGTEEFVLASAGTTKKITAANLALAGAANSEMAYAQITANQDVTGTSEGAATTVVTAGSFTADGTSAYLIEFFAPTARPDSTTAGNTLEIWLYEDGSSIGKLAVFQLQVNGVATLVPLSLQRRLVPSSGSRTYSIRASVNTGTGVIVAGAGGSGATVPAFIRITKV